MQPKSAWFSVYIQPKSGLGKVGRELGLIRFGIFPGEQCEEIEGKGVLRDFSIRS